MVRIIIPVLLATAVLISGAKMRDPQSGTETISIYDAATGQVQEVSRVHRTDAGWRSNLTPEQYQVMRLKGTEKPFETACSIPATGKTGIYKCIGCGTDLFRHESKFDSGTGWPSFWEPVSPLNTRLEPDDNHGMHRTEVLCARCDSHLGHVFDDGPRPSGKRFCINSVALKLVESAEQAEHEKATFAAGCFWGVESAFRQLLGKGVIATRVGYTGGHVKNPTYKDVCSNTTGHAEAVEIDYDPGNISYQDMLALFWSIHDPTTLDAQGPDVGSQYRSAIFFHTPQQRRLAEESKGKLEDSKRFAGRIVTDIEAASEFYAAEDYHQHYFEKRGIEPACHIPVKE